MIPSPLSRTPSYASLSEVRTAEGDKKPQSGSAPAGEPNPQGAQSSLLPPSGEGAMRRRLSSHFAGSDNVLHPSAGQEVTVTGGTSTVGIHQGSIFNGKPKDALASGTRWNIDINNAVWSRRGPNQEVAGNKREDAAHTENATHAWYPQHSGDTGNYLKNDWPHLRADAFLTTTGTPGTSLDKALPANLRARAAPNTGYRSVASFASVKEFVAHQQAYQNELASKFTPASIMSSHRSVGFEYEFTQHSLGDDFPSHVSLARSKPLSNLFKLSCELETDSGAVVEIGLPPFLVPNNHDGTVNKSELDQIHTAMQDTMAKIRNEAHNVPLVRLVEIIEKHGLGTGWEMSAPKLPAQAGLTVTQPTGGKLAGKGDGPNIYSQMNISLTGDESAQFIASAKEKFKSLPNFAEEGILGTTFNELEGLAKETLGEHAAQATHLNKALANILAIPSILLQKIASEELPREQDLSSAVKELYSLWVKDSLPNILATSSASGERLQDFARTASAHVLQKLEGVPDQMQEISFKRDKENASWKKAESFCDALDYAGCAELLRTLKHSVPEEHKSEVVKLTLELQNMMEESGDYTAETERTLGDRADEIFAARSAAIGAAIGAKIAETDRATIIAGITTQAKDEVKNLVALMHSPDAVQVARTTFGEETFGDGKGVRKDTFIPQAAGPIAGLRTSVAEVRSDPAIAHFLKKD